MMEAVARRKAHWLFRTGSERSFSGKRRPQEDMVTSAVFGSIRLLSPADRRKAIELIVGEECFNAALFPDDQDIEITLWPSLPGPDGGGRVEPDILLISARRTVIIEVKWHAHLSEDQLEKQVAAAELDKHNVVAVQMLGEAIVKDAISGKPCFRRTWRDVSGAVQERLRYGGDKSGAFCNWLCIMRDFLRQTDMGRIFAGLDKNIRGVRPVSYRFSKPGHPPWMRPAPMPITTVHYMFGAKE